eukprot:gnl/Chilomastix_cuspidata/5626.p1 GENE.gnl/Chilomastix_cuspidata/5626~~gnl/Chilomastix_cuspidata/5626.p1  ORF type:complete len:107 (+),score=9.73 gnl/Chilomastix_cuspidata/5626:141-461(+)
MDAKNGKPGPKPPIAKRSRRREGLKVTTQRVMSLLQTNGPSNFQDIHGTMDIDYRRVYDVLNVLTSTKIVRKTHPRLAIGVPDRYTYLSMPAPHARQEARAAGQPL